MLKEVNRAKRRLHRPEEQQTNGTAPADPASAVGRGQTVARLRKLAGLNQARLAALLHADQSYVSKLEQGKVDLANVSAHRLAQLAHALRVPVSELSAVARLGPKELYLSEDDELHYASPPPEMPGFDSPPFAQPLQLTYTGPRDESKREYLFVPTHPVERNGLPLALMAVRQTGTEMSPYLDRGDIAIAVMIPAVGGPSVVPTPGDYVVVIDEAAPAKWEGETPHSQETYDIRRLVWRDDDCFIVETLRPGRAEERMQRHATGSRKSIWAKVVRRIKES